MSPAGSSPDPSPPAPDERSAERERMVRSQLASRGIAERRVLDAIARVPRHAFVPGAAAGSAYEDSPLAIGEGQTISQPYIVGLMTELLDVGAGDRVLEIGTGSGYQTAVLAELAAEVYSVEILEELLAPARDRLRRLGYDRVHLRRADGWEGWPEAAPFDRILVTACATAIPPTLVRQLRRGGIMVLPVGDPAGEQRLQRVTRGEGSDMDIEEGVPVRFVPMTREEGHE